MVLEDPRGGAERRSRRVGNVPSVAPGSANRESELCREWSVVSISRTFTDCVLIDENGRVAYGKALSSPADSFKSGFFGSIESAGDQLGLDAGDLYTKMDRADLARLDRRHQHRGRAQGRRDRADHHARLRGHGADDARPGRPTGEPPENLLRFAETRKPEPLVPIERTFGVAERIDSDGDVVVELDEAAVAAAADALVEAGVETIAIAFLLVGPQRRPRAARPRKIVADRAPASS